MTRKQVRFEKESIQDISDKSIRGSTEYYNITKRIRHHIIKYWNFRKKNKQMVLFITQTPVSLSSIQCLGALSLLRWCLGPRTINYKWVECICKYDNSFERKKRQNKASKDGN